MNEDNHESSSSGCDNQMYVLTLLQFSVTFFSLTEFVRILRKKLKTRSNQMHQLETTKDRVQIEFPSDSLYFSEFLVSEAERRRRVNHLDTEVHELGYDPFSYCGRRVHVLVS